MMPGPQLNWNGGSPIDRSCRIIKRNLTNIQDFVLLILLFQIVIVTLRLFWETFTPIKSLWKDDQNGFRKFKRSARRWNSWKIFRYEGSGPSKTRFMWVYLAKMTIFRNSVNFNQKMPLNLFCQSCRFRSKTALNRQIMIYQNYEISKLVKNHDKRLIKIDFAKWFQIFPLDHSIR